MPKTEANGEYNVHKIRQLIAILDANMTKKPVLDQTQAAHIINGLIRSLEHAVNTIEFLNKQAMMDKMMAIGGMGSNAKN